MKNTLKNIEIKQLFQIGKWISTANISAIYSHSDSFKYMVTAPYKNYKRANQRNKIKRLLRNSIFKNNNSNINIGFVYKSKTILDSVIIEKEINEIFNKVHINTN